MSRVYSTVAQLAASVAVVCALLAVLAVPSSAIADEPGGEDDGPFFYTCVYRLNNCPNYDCMFEPYCCYQQTTQNCKCFDEKPNGVCN